MGLVGGCAWGCGEGGRGGKGKGKGKGFLRV